ncbi:MULTISPECIES: electron transfer flavoprotein subunit alpha/FixB family protein [Exiguobacterium]|jgi:electron transfer flavoprotein alpha subunit|uniref:Electron transfer flavoprotein alpha/beta-subunit n=2 Tax=Exiguobacterium TaxID=33986 RepID=C4L4G7_EXISA|nr:MULTISPECIES: electron transfer flavoprotein subunit alpha/FixB family protein [Exiguobacterium]MCC9623307.1 electron transfer flavoprotein subunit alpha/FixB family protein [Thalassospira sp. MA62]QPI66918.1 electron transfer flavoprotein subunit alpha/FixB family protein [Exiguobacterium sp. PBE]ACQ71530.1 Electron transfer flavoprotein alpha/beta-subunit [Exiguobacterium sp. AT1b]MBG0916430.1 electron transfer flavoprotein subunit alpha/FixB family protein [Exiguobacterium sp. SRB7LM]MBQ
MKALVLAEAREGALRNVSFEAIAAAKQLTDDVTAVVIGDHVQSLAQELGEYGASRVLVVEDDRLKHYTPDGYGQVLRQLIEQENPEMIVLGHTALGKDIAPKLAARLDAGLISDVVSIEGTGRDAEFVRPIYSGKAFEKVKFKDSVMFFTIRPNNIDALARQAGASVSVETPAVELKDLAMIVKEVVRKATGKVDLAEAKVIVAGGRGVKSEDGFKPLEELAELLGGAVGASRGACDADYCDYALQIGQTGKVVTPDLYIACGISGAIQHLAGMSNAKVIVAINKDPEANIFSVADYGIVGDLFDVVPMLTEEFRKHLVNS